MRPTINTEKHYFQQSLTTVEENTVFSTNILVANANPTGPNHVRIGAIVSAIFVEIWMLSSSAQPTFQICTVEKIVAGGDRPTSAQMSVLHDYPNKKNILFSSQGLVGDANSNPIPVLRQWIKIPKGKQRFGNEDAMILNVAARGEANNDVQICGEFVYKEQF